MLAAAFGYPEGPDPLQGDLFDGLPFLLARDLPIRVVRYFQEGKHGPVWIQYNDGAPRQPTKSQIDLDYKAGGETVIAVGFKGLGIVLSHDCEIENAPDHVLVAPVLPWSNLAAEHRGETERGERWDVFPLAGQNGPPEVAKSYVKFARVTVVHHDVLAGCERVASAEDSLRKPLTMAFFHYLLHPERTA